MPRPRKCRKVCSLPKNNEFGVIPTEDKLQTIVYMSVEEYECIRLIDYEGLMQEECAERMNVARATVQRIYNDARKKIADVIVNGLLLKIEGGDYQVCQNNINGHSCPNCHKRDKDFTLKS